MADSMTPIPTPAPTQKLVLVTDPMCSWCWGMADEFARARRDLAGRVTFELMLGGINTHGTQPIGDYGRRFLVKLWREVADTTGQKFGFKLPAEYVHNSALACMALEVVRDVIEAPPFDYLHVLQERFFVHGENINALALLAELAVPFGVEQKVFNLNMAAPAIKHRVKFQFEHASGFGTEALPSLLIERHGKLQLFAGGYLDAKMLCELVDNEQAEA